jgi:hypothetical protein
VTHAVVLDAGAFDTIDSPAGGDLRALLRASLANGGEIRCAAVVLAEVCRGPARTQRAEVALRRDRGGSPVRVVPTDERLAKLVGAILHGTASDSSRLADAHAVAVCHDVDRAVVVTSDPGDITALAAALPLVRILTARP